MPKITIDRSTSTNDPGRISQRISQPGTLSPAGTSGQDKFRKIQEDIGFAIADKQKKIVENNYLANARINASKRITEAKNKLLGEMEDPVGYANNLSSEMDSIYDELLRQAPTQESRAALQNVFAQQKIASYQQAVAQENKILSEKVLSDASNNIDQLAIDIFEEPQSFNTRLADIDSIVDSTTDVLSPIEQGKFKELSKKRLTDYYMKGLIDKDLGEAEVFANGEAIQSIFSPEEILKYRDAVERKKVQVVNELVKQRNQEQESLALNRELGIFRGEVSQLQLDEDLEKGNYGIQEYLSLSNKLRTTERTALNNRNVIESINARQEAGLPFDTSDSNVKKDLNTYFNEVVAPMITAENSDQMVSTFVDKFNFIPDSVKSNLIAGLHNGNPQQAVTSARLIESLTTNNPSLVRQFSATNDIARARLISTSVLAGMPEADAIKAANNMVIQKGTVEQEQRQKEFNKAKVEFDQEEITSWFVNDPNTVPSAMKSDWKQLVENYMVNLKVPMDDAKALAYKIVNSEWGITDVGAFKESERLTEEGKKAGKVKAALLEGRGELKEKFAKPEKSYMKYAPEKYYNQNGLDPQWINKQLVEDVKVLDPELNDFNLSVDPDTIGSERPGYFVNYVSENGIPLQLRDQDGNLLLWRPDISTSEDAAKQIKAAQENFKIIEQDIITLDPIQEEAEEGLKELLGIKKTS